MNYIPLIICLLTSAVLFVLKAVGLTTISWWLVVLPAVLMPLTLIAVVLLGLSVYLLILFLMLIVFIVQALVDKFK